MELSRNEFPKTGFVVFRYVRTYCVIKPVFSLGVTHHGLSTNYTKLCLLFDLDAIMAMWRLWYFLVGVSRKLVRHGGVNGFHGGEVHEKRMLLFN